MPLIITVLRLLADGILAHGDGKFNTGVSYGITIGLSLDVGHRYQYSYCVH